MNLALLSLAILPATASDWPLQPRPEVVHGFELPAKPWLPGHRGVDLAGHPGQPVLAATPGTITYAGPLAGRGIITITTGRRRTTYEPVVPAVSVGATVTTGTIIGRLSTAGSHCLPRTCLHWGLLQGKQYLNPLTLVPNRPVRLLPLTNQLPQPAQPIGALTQPAQPVGAPAQPVGAPAQPAQPVGAPAQPPPQPIAQPPIQPPPPSPPPAPAPADASAARAHAAEASAATNQRTAKLIIAATAALTLTAGLLIRRE
ncbi:M23 family metallopeptidase [Kribbella jiaozuonensis]|uniref:M23 family metallopeptidase n=1 Tax=Kribbella jiaozuonensis TaxID=2575441 RepID=UPI00192D7CBD|nr:M23 family metallopeptidase [Kribbella jiaozuonensis]